MSPFGKRSEMPNFFQFIYFVIVCGLIIPLPCVNSRAFWGNEKGWWRWSRLFQRQRRQKDDEEAQRQRTRCCASERDAWRQQARRDGLLLHSSSRRSDRLKSTFNGALHLGERPPPTFRFLDLPTELRERIYVAYFDSWSSQRILSPYSPPVAPGLPIPPHEPPLIRVSKVIRSESLALFHKTHRFPLILHLQDGRTRPPYHSFKEVDWYANLTPDKLSKIRKVEVYFCLKNTVGWGPAPGMNFLVNLADPLHPVRSARSFTPRDSPEEWCIDSWTGYVSPWYGGENLQQALEKRVRAVVETLASGRPFTKELMYSLVPTREDFERDLVGWYF